MKTSEKKDERAMHQAASQLESIKELMFRLETAQNQDADNFDEIDGMREEIDQSPLSVEVRSGWYTPGGDEPSPAEFMILLCTGGPAVRSIGDLEDNTPTSARLEYQDWFTKWEEYPVYGLDLETLLAYCNHFIF